MSRPNLVPANPATYNPNAVGVVVRPGDIVVDLTGATPGVAIITGAPGARTLVAVGGGAGGLQTTGIALLVTTPGAAGTARITVTVKDAGTDVPIVGALVQLAVSSASPLISGSAGPVGTVGASVLDGNNARSLILVGLTGAGGVVDFDVIGTAAQGLDAAGVVLFPLPSLTTIAGNFKP